jgi:hypothetical protein
VFCFRSQIFFADPVELFSIAHRSADRANTMDWEGGTNGAIVPALMGYGEAGRASPWPFSCDDNLIGIKSAPQQNSR